MKQGNIYIYIHICLGVHRFLHELMLFIYYSIHTVFFLQWYDILHYYTNHFPPLRLFRLDLNMELPQGQTGSVGASVASAEQVNTLLSSLNEFFWVTMFKENFKLKANFFIGWIIHIKRNTSS